MTIRDTVNLLIERMGQAGDGVARLADGRLAFVPGALPGEAVSARITEERQSFVRAQVQSYLHTAPERIKPICPIYDLCGGCTFQHWNYHAELQYKETRVREALSRIAGIADPPLEPIRGSRNAYGYRNKGQFPFGGKPGEVTLGLYRRNTHQVIDAVHCDIQDSLVNDVLSVGREVANQAGLPPYDEASDRGILRHLLIRSSQQEQKLLILLVVRRHHPALKEMAELLMKKVPAIAGVGLNINDERTNRVLGRTTETLLGTPYIFDRILGLKFRLSFTSFFQVNPTQVSTLYQAALDLMPESPGDVWDLYSGVGTLAALAATKARRVRAVEVNQNTAEDAQYNFHMNHLTHAAVDVGMVEVLMARWVREAEKRPDAVIVDPPRSGLDPEVIASLLMLKPERIIYVSCNPDTWARDVKVLREGFTLQSVIPVDMFPRTDHVECCSLLVRNET